MVQKLATAGQDQPLLLVLISSASGKPPTRFSGQVQLPLLAVIKKTASHPHG
jgi:hypothetical protein